MAADMLMIEDLRREIETLRETREQTENTPAAGSITPPDAARMAELEADLAAATEANKRLTLQAGSHAVETAKVEEDLRARVAALEAGERNLRAELSVTKANAEQVKINAAKAVAKGKVISIDVAEENMSFTSHASRLFMHLQPRASTLDPTVKGLVSAMAKSFG
jgi:hypothetical protein